MSKNIAIITLIGNNYGNRLQNYALQTYLKNNNLFAITIANNSFLNNKRLSIKDWIKYIISIFKHELILHDGVYRIKNYLLVNKRTRLFLHFNQYINFSNHYFHFHNYLDFDYYFVGSDQVWNPYFGLNDFGLLEYVDDNNKKISFSASIGTDSIPNEMKKKYGNSIKKFKSISVREDKAKELIENISGRKDVKVLIDPTMLLTSDEWDKVSKRPKQLDSIKGKKYILNYFLGELSQERKEEIEKIAKEKDCHIINILDKKDPFYISGPSEFLYLEKHAFLICTDSFHSSVFAIIYNRPFVIFEREQKNVESMSSRIDTLLNKFKLDNRRYNGKNITKENLKHDYTEAYRILEEEREKSKKFLEKALDIE